MTAEEIRNELHKNTAEVFPEAQKSLEGTLGLLQYSAQMEIAAQLAELNARKKLTIKTLDEVFAAAVEKGIAHTPVERVELKNLLAQRGLIE